MKKINLKTIVVSLVALAILAFFSVFAINFFGMFTLKNDSAQSSNGGYDTASPQMPSESPPTQEEIGIPNFTGKDGEKIISTFSLDFETVTFQEHMNTLRKMVTTYESYIESSDIYQQGSYEGRTYQYGTLTIRVPKEKANAFIEEGKKQFHLVRENSSAQNVTLYYQDTQLRLDTLIKQKDRLNELYEDAEKIEDIIAIESKLSDVILQIESIKSELDYLDRSIDYATITVSLNEVANLSSSTDIRASFSERIAAAFRDSFRFFKEATADFAVFLVYALPFMVIGLVVILMVSLMIKGIRKKKKTVIKNHNPHEKP